SFGSKGLFRGRRRILQTIPERDRFLPQTGLVSISSETMDLKMRKGPMVSLGKDYRAEIAHRAICGTNILVCPFWSRTGRKACPKCLCCERGAATAAARSIRIRKGES